MANINVNLNSYAAEEGRFDLVNTKVGLMIDGLVAAPNTLVANPFTALINGGAGPTTSSYAPVGPGTYTVVTSSQTQNRVIVLPDISDVLITKNSVDILTNKTLISNTDNVTARALWSGGTSPSVLPTNTINVSNSANPTADQVLTATNSTTATWQNPTASGLYSGGPTNPNIVVVNLATSPSSGQVLTATSATNATWQTPGSGSATLINSAYACSNTTTSVAAQGFFTFNDVPAAVGLNITPPTPGGTTFTINMAGTYKFEFQARGTPQTLTPPTPIVLRLLNGVTPVANSQYASDSQTTSLAAFPNGTELCVGFGYATFAAGATVQLQNWTAAGGGSVSLNSIPLGGDATINASLLFTQLM